MDADQNKVIEYLAEAGWIAKVSEKSDSSVMIQWTQDGIERLRTLNEIFQEVTYDLMKRDQFAFFGLLVRLSGFVGSDDNGVTVLGALNPPKDKEPPPHQT